MTSLQAGLFGLFDLALVVLVVGLLVHGYYVMRNRVPFVALPDGALETVVIKLGVANGDRMYELGCGDGRVISALHRDNPNASYFGVENNPMVWMLARWQLRGRAVVIRGEISAADLAGVKRVFVYLGREAMAELEPKFERELPKGARVVSAQFALPGRRPDEVVELEHSLSHAAKLYIYNY